MQRDDRYRHIFKFQHTAARRRLGAPVTLSVIACWFQHTAARRRLVTCAWFVYGALEFQHTAARRRLANVGGKIN